MYNIIKIIYILCLFYGTEFAFYFAVFCLLSILLVENIVPIFEYRHLKIIYP